MTRLAQAATSRALVTGASGFIGTRLCRSLRESGVEVHAVSRVARRDGDMRWWTVDVTDDESFARLARDVRPDVVFHLASHVSGSRALGAVVPTLRANLASAVNVLVVAAEIGCHVVLAGSSEEPDQNAPLPVSPYAAAKFAASTYAEMFRRMYGVSVVTLRIFMVYGPGQRDETKLIPYVITSFLHGEAPRLASGTRPVDWVFVDDVVEALLAASRARDLDGQPLDVGSGVLTPVRAVVEEIVRRMRPSVEPLFGAVSDRADERMRVASLGETAAQLGWRPRTSLASGLGATIEWYSMKAGER